MNCPAWTVPNAPVLISFALSGASALNLAVLRHVQDLQRTAAVRRADLDAGAVFEGDLGRGVLNRGDPLPQPRRQALIGERDFRQLLFGVDQRIVDDAG